MIMREKRMDNMGKHPSTVSISVSFTYVFGNF